MSQYAESRGLLCHGANGPDALTSDTAHVLPRLLPCAGLALLFLCCERLPREIGRWHISDGQVIVQTGDWMYVRKPDGTIDVQSYPPCILDYEPIRGLSNGVFAAYFQNNVIGHSCTISNGVIHGLWETWHPSRVRAMYGMVVHGERRGIWLWWNGQGSLTQVAYVDTTGQEEVLSITEDGSIMRYFVEPGL